MNRSRLQSALRWLLPQLDSRVLWFVMLANLALQCGYLLPQCLMRVFPMADVDVYAMAAENVVTRQPLYPLTPTGDPRTPEGGYLPFLYPPPFAAVLAPLGYLPHLTIVRLLFFVTFAAFWAYAAALGRLVTGRFSLRGMLGAGLILIAFPGAYFNLVAGQGVVE